MHQEKRLTQDTAYQIEGLWMFLAFFVNDLNFQSFLLQLRPKL